MTLFPSLTQSLTDKQLLIFDFDGTIADTSPLHNQAFVDTLSPLGVSVSYPHIAGLRTAEAILTCMDQSGLVLPSHDELQSLVVEKQRRVRSLITTYLQPFPPMNAFLQWAKYRYQLALVTSGSRATVTLALQKLAYTSLFHPQIFAEDVASGKPDPEGFLLALKLSSCIPENALVFEDSEAGFHAAISANISYINVNEHFPLSS